jgi:hypothetical protein
LSDEVKAKFTYSFKRKVSLQQETRSVLRCECGTDLSLSLSLAIVYRHLHQAVLQ